MKVYEIIILVFIMYITLIFNQPSNEYIKLVSLERNQEVNGNFVLGFGQIDTQIRYYAYENKGNNRYKLVKLPNVDIIESNIIEPHYEKIVKCNFGICGTTKDVIYVPEGTIKEEFNL